jgi:hypothetical protein
VALGDTGGPLAACGQVGLLLGLAALGDAWWTWLSSALIWFELRRRDRPLDRPGRPAVEIETVVAAYLLACERRQLPAGAAVVAPLGGEPGVPAIVVELGRSWPAAWSTELLGSASARASAQGLAV